MYLIFLFYISEKGMYQAALAPLLRRLSVR